MMSDQHEEGGKQEQKCEKSATLEPQQPQEAFCPDSAMEL